jgi:vacuolar-type H+-ATPase subunit I/STV1
MKRFSRIMGWTAVTIGVLLILVGIHSWPPGGLMFALPFVFLMPGILLALVGAVLVRMGRDSRKPEPPPVERTPGS